MIYDTFVFFNELDLLEIRLNILDPFVDRFVLVEATRTFQKKEKPLFFLQNQERFKKFLPKIKHIVVDQYPNFFTKWRIPKSWDYDNHQKEAILKGLLDCHDDDVIIVSDVDEIPNPKQLRLFQADKGIHVFQQRLYYYYLNCWVKDYEEPIEVIDDFKPWYGSVMATYKNLKSVKTIKAFRAKKDLKPPHVAIIPNGGWHFSYLGGTQTILAKIEAVAHTEFNKPEYKNPEKIETLVRQGQDLFGRKIKSVLHPIDSSMPDYIQNNQSLYSHLLLQPSTL